MHIAATVAGIVLIVLIHVDGFETVVQPRRVARRYRISRIYYLAFWTLWHWVACKLLARSKRRVAFLSTFGPLSLLGLFALWVAGLVVGFAILHWSLRDPLSVNFGTADTRFGTYLYLSGTTFFTLGYGDVTPTGPLGRFFAVSEAGLGFGFLAAILSYLPALFQAYAGREVMISLLDARAGSPPCAGQLILRAARAQNTIALNLFLAEMERWSAELLASQLSFPVLGFYRSQHDNQSWLAALTTVLDTCALTMTQSRDVNHYQAQVTFAIARHAAVDLTLVLRAKPPAALGMDPKADRLPPEQFTALRQNLSAAGIPLREEAGAEEALRQLRSTYEPFLQGLGERLLLKVPPVMAPDGHLDNWQRSAWMKPVPGLTALPAEATTPAPSALTPDERHFD